jgi:hypothetical protein
MHYFAKLTMYTTCSRVYCHYFYVLHEVLRYCWNSGLAPLLAVDVTMYAVTFVRHLVSGWRLFALLVYHVALNDGPGGLKRVEEKMQILDTILFLACRSKSVVRIEDATKWNDEKFI